MSEKILVVDDDKDIRNLIQVYLKNEKFEVDHATNGEEALDKIQNTAYDLILLDVMMPKLDGISTCIKIRENYGMPIIFLSAKDEEIHKIQGLTVGADDYVTKPFGSMELIARVKAQLRRYHQLNSPPTKSNIIEIQDLIINLETHEVKIEGKSIKLTPKEFAILATLAQNKGMVFSVEKLYETVWGESYVVSDSSIVVHITNLRQKVEKDPKNPQYIKTVWGVGYKI